MSRFALLPAALLLFLTAAPVAAAAPVKSTTIFTYTLADAIAEYEEFGIYDGDCGDFVLLVDFEVVRDVTTWPDREIRHVRYDGHFYKASDTSKSIARNGDFTLTFEFDSAGELQALTQTGLFEYVVIDGHRKPTIVGRATIDFTSDPPTEWTTPQASPVTPDFVCDALR